MIRTIYWFINFGLVLVGQAFWVLNFNKLKKVTDKDKFAKLVEEHTAKWALNRIKASGSHITVIGSENVPKEKAVLFVSNHQGNFDIPTLIAYVRTPKGFLSKIEVKKIPVIGKWMEFMQCIFMDRNDMKQSAQSIIDGIELLKSGHSLVLFPEGTRSKSNEMGEFKAGSFKLATKSKVDIVPITINGTYKIMENNNNKIRPTDVIVTIHKPIETKDLTREEMAELPDKVKKIIQSSLEKRN